MMNGTGDQNNRVGNLAAATARSSARPVPTSVGGDFVQQGVAVDERHGVDLEDPAGGGPGGALLACASNGEIQHGGLGRVDSVHGDAFDMAGDGVTGVLKPGQHSAGPVSCCSMACHG